MPVKEQAHVRTKKSLVSVTIGAFRLEKRWTLSKTPSSSIKTQDVPEVVLGVPVNLALFAGGRGGGAAKGPLRKVKIHPSPLPPYLPASAGDLKPV